MILSNTLRRTRSYAYDAVNDLGQEIGAQGQTLAYGHDLQGNLASVTDGNGNVTLYGYDTLNRLIGMIDPNKGVIRLRCERPSHGHHRPA